MWLTKSGFLYWWFPSLDDSHNHRSIIALRINWNVVILGRPIYTDNFPSHCTKLSESSRFGPILTFGLTSNFNSLMFFFPIFFVHFIHSFFACEKYPWYTFFGGFFDRPERKLLNRFPLLTSFFSFGIHGPCGIGFLELFKFIYYWLEFYDIVCADNTQSSRLYLGNRYCLVCDIFGF